jgi:hypothetical protein
MCGTTTLGGPKHHLFYVRAPHRIPSSFAQRNQFLHPVTSGSKPEQQKQHRVTDVLHQDLKTNKREVNKKNT